MKAMEYYQKRVEDFLKRGRSFDESAYLMVSAGVLAEVDQLGYDRVYLSGWLGGFNLEKRIEKFKGVGNYEKGWKDGEKFRVDVRGRYVN